MPTRLAFASIWPVCVTGFFLFIGSSVPGAEVRDRAVVGLQFTDVAAGMDVRTAQDSAKAGAGADAVTLPAGGAAVAEVFAGGSGSAIVLSPATQQYISVANSSDVGRGDAVSVSGMFMSLHPLNDGTYHGLFARRQAAAPNKTNYGINYTLAGDVFQAYVNDGSGYKAVVYSAAGTIGAFRRVHVTAVWQQGDAPDADADTDADDIRVRLYINGVAVAPRSVSAGAVAGVDGWLYDVSLANCQSDTPLTIGSSFANGELTQLACDDVYVFPEAINDSDARQLFLEVAGSEADAIAAETSVPVSTSASAPVVTHVNLRGLQIGTANKIALTGQNLKGAKIRIGSPPWPVQVTADEDPGMLACTIEVPANAVPGRYVLRVLNSDGASQPLIMSVDKLAAFNLTQISQENPLTALPAAVTGVISGTEQQRVYFAARAGQKISAEIEARRLGSGLDPVVEIRNPAGGPVGIQWQQPDLAGDARVSFTVPADGIYTAEIHDLQFRAPGNSPWRMLIGELPGTSATFPPVTLTAGGTVRTLGPAGASEPVVLKSTGDQIVLESGNAIVPFSGLVTENGPSAVEPMEGTFDANPLDAKFTAAPFLPLTIHGRISEPGQADQIQLAVTAGQTLYIQCRGRSIGSSIRPEITLFNGDAAVAGSNGDAGAADPALSYSVPEGVTQLRLQVKDFTGRGNPASLYRAVISRSDRPGFSIRTREQFVSLPANGSAPLRISVIRQAPDFRYHGPIRLSVRGISGIAIEPEVIPASDRNQELFVLLSRTATAENSLANHGLVLEGRTEGLEANITRDVELQVDELKDTIVTFRDDEVLSGTGQPLVATVAIDGISPILFRGMSATLPIRVFSIRPERMPYARFRLLTTEAARKQNPADPNSPELARVSAPDYQFVATDSGVTGLKINVPLDIAEPVIYGIVAAEFVSKPLAPTAGQTAWTAPLAMPVEYAAQVTIPGEAVKLKKGAATSVTVAVQRHPLFAEPLQIRLMGLSQGYAASTSNVEPGTTSATIEITVPAEAAAGDVPNVTVQVVRSSGEVLFSSPAMKLTAE